METVGFIGLGNMGTAIVGNIQRAGYPMVVHDIREEATRIFVQGGAQLARSAAEVARLGEVVFTSLPGPEQVEEVAIGPNGLLEGIRPGSIYVDLSTSRSSLIRRIDEIFRQKEAHVLDAPLSGGAARGLQQVMVSGEQGVYERIRPILATFADRVLYVGGIGSGSVCKLVHNMVQRGIAHVLPKDLPLA